MTDYTPPKMQLTVCVIVCFIAAVCNGHGYSDSYGHGSHRGGYGGGRGGGGGYNR